MVCPVILLYRYLGIRGYRYERVMEVNNVIVLPSKKPEEQAQHSLAFKVRLLISHLRTFFFTFDIIVLKICWSLSGQRQSLRYWYDREWLSNGHMYGLSFLEENYSHQNAKKITTTHQLLGDVHHLVEVLNGLQLKMSVLQWVKSQRRAFALNCPR